MSYNIISTKSFEKKLKKLIKKYPSLKKDLEDLEKKLENDPKLGTSIGNNCYKVRISISSKNKGKSAGARIITHLYVAKSTIFLIAIYDKSDQDSVSNEEIMRLTLDLEEIYKQV